jgi:replicative DNA helicase
VTLARAIPKDGPWDESLEQNVLACMLLHESAASWASESLAAELFFRPGHRTIFRIIQGLVRKGFDADHLTVKSALANERQLENVGGADYLLHLADEVGISGPSNRARVRQYGQDLQLLYVRRVLMERANNLARTAEEGGMELEELLAKAGEMATQLVTVGSDTYCTTSYDPSVRSALRGVPTGLPCIDKYVGANGVGFPRGNVTMVGAKRGSGKTGFLVSSMVHARKANLKVAYTTLEMRGDSISNRMTKSLCGFDVTPNVSHYVIEYLDAVKLVQEWAVKMWDPSGKRGSEKTIQALTAWVVHIKETIGLDALYVDYFQLFRASGRFDNRTRELDYIADEFMWLGQSLDIAVVVGSQLSKTPDGAWRAKDSIKLEDNAELVLYLEKEKTPPNVSVSDATITIGKNRHGREGVEEVRWNGSHVRFEEKAYDPYAD